MKIIFTLFSLMLCFTMLGQLPDGAIAPDFDLDDIDGDSHNLYEYLDEGKSVILDFSATWCGPCWSYHNSGVLDDMYTTYGPGGTDQIMVFMVEADPSTSQDCIYGLSSCTGGTIGDWTNTSYPILNPDSAEASDINNDYSINFWPTLYGVAPNGEVALVGQAGTSGWESVVINSFQMANSFYEVSGSGCEYIIDVTPMAGEGDIEYEWSTGETTEDLNNVAGGEYYVTLTDENDFEVVLGPIDIDGGDPHTLEELGTTHVQCYGESSGSIELDITGGSGSFTYEWSNGSTELSQFNLPEGDYSLNVYDDVFECTSEIFFFIEQPEEVLIYFETAPAACNQDGLVTFDVIGGYPPYTFQFADFSTGNPEIALAAGEYSVLVIDSDGCEEGVDINIEALDIPTLQTSSSNALNCTTPMTTLNGTTNSTSTNISYAWYDSANNLIGSTQQIIVANVGTYTLQMTDLNSNCQVTSQAIVDGNLNAPMSVSGYSNAIDCMNSTATLNSGGSSSGANIAYSWTTSDGMITSAANGPTITVGSGGTYVLSVLDSTNGCSSTSTVVVPDSADIPSSAIAGETNFCEGNSSTLCVNLQDSVTASWTVDGVAAGSESCITISSSAMVSVTLNNTTNGCSSSQMVQTTTVAQPNATVTGDFAFCEGSSTMLCVTVAADETISWNNAGANIGSESCVVVANAGSVQATLTNSMGCSSTAEIQTSVLAAPSAAVSGPMAICEGLSANICANESDDASYEWKLNGMIISSESCVTIDQVGQVELHVTHVTTNCVSSNSFDINQAVSPEFSLNASGIIDCDNPSVVISVQATEPYAYSWSDANGNVISGDLEITVLASGTYSLTAETQTGCSTTTDINIEQGENAFAVPSFNSDSDNLTIYFENTTQGNTTEVMWDFGDGSTSTDLNPSYTFSEAGFYTVCLTTTNDCGSSTQCEDILAAFAISVDANVSTINCFGGSDGAISIVSVEGGLPGYTYEWEHDNSTLTELNGLTAGDYTLNILDSAGNSYSRTFTILEPEEIILTPTIVNTTGGEDNGSIQLDISGGVGPFTYAWSLGSTENSVANLAIGTYTILIIDANGCEKEESFEVTASTGIENIEFLIDFNVHPNPASDVLNFELNLHGNQNVNVSLISVIGHKVYNQSYQGETISDNISIDHLNQGIYFLKLSALDGSGNEIASESKKVFIIR